MAMRNSVPGFPGSWVSWDTPPKMNRVIALTCMPAACATRLWASSWASTEAKKRILVIAAMSQFVVVLQS